MLDHISLNNTFANISSLNILSNQRKYLALLLAQTWKQFQYLWKQFQYLWKQSRLFHFRFANVMHTAKFEKVMQNPGQIIISDKAGIITFLRNQTIHKFILCKGSWNYLCKILWKMKQEYIDDLSQFIYICIYIRKLKKNSIYW